MSDQSTNPTDLTQLTQLITNGFATLTTQLAAQSERMNELETTVMRLQELKANGQLESFAQQLTDNDASMYAAIKADGEQQQITYPALSMTNEQAVDYGLGILRGDNPGIHDQLGGNVIVAIIDPETQQHRY